MFVLISLVLTMIALIPGNSTDGEIVEAQATEQGQFKEVFLQAQAQDTSSNTIVVEKVIGPDGGGLGKILYEDTSDRLAGSGAAVVAIGEGMLIDETEVKFTIFPENTKTYPTAAFIQNLYSTDKVRYIGPVTTLEIASSSLRLDSPDDQLLFTISPSFYENELDEVKQRDIRLEVRVFLKGGNTAFHTMRFGYAGEAPIWSDFLKASFGADLPETVKISVQAVDISDALPNPDDFLGP